MVFLEGSVPSLKNSKVKAKNGIFSSKTVGKFLRGIGIQTFSSSKKTVKGYVDPNRPNKFEALREEFMKMKKGKGSPMFIGFHQVRKTRAAFDFGNSVELIQDLLTAHDIIEDDNVRFVFPVPMSIDGEFPTEDTLRTTKWYTVDKENPGVYIKFF